MSNDSAPIAFVHRSRRLIAGWLFGLAINACALTSLVGSASAQMLAPPSQTDPGAVHGVPAVPTVATRQLAPVPSAPTVVAPVQPASNVQPTIVRPSAASIGGLPSAPVPSPSRAAPTPRAVAPPAAVPPLQSNESAPEQLLDSPPSPLPVTVPLPPASDVLNPSSAPTDLVSAPNSLSPAAALPTEPQLSDTTTSILGVLSPTAPTTESVAIEAPGPVPTGGPGQAPPPNAVVTDPAVGQSRLVQPVLAASSDAGGIRTPATAAIPATATNESRPVNDAIDAIVDATPNPTDEVPSAIESIDPVRGDSGGSEWGIATAPPDIARDLQTGRLSAILSSTGSIDVIFAAEQGTQDSRTAPAPSQVPAAGAGRTIPLQLILGPRALTPASITASGPGAPGPAALSLVLSVLITTGAVLRPRLVHVPPSTGPPVLTPPG
ncbi:MAG: hypothetical protein QOF51_522 [Chloroflexota bacterium]|jgi:hypothetical protein|nr:hypothetical protein [Chloroflexota bacterium]